MVAASTLSKQGTELVNLYIEIYVKKYDRSPEINRFKQKWGFISMIEDYKFPTAKKIIEYYFKTDRFGHPVEHLLYNYETLYKNMVEQDRDAAERERLLRETEQRVREWEARGNK